MNAVWEVQTPSSAGSQLFVGGEADKWEGQPIQVEKEEGNPM